MEAAEARPSLHLSKCQIVGNLMPRLNCKSRESPALVLLICCEFFACWVIFQAFVVVCRLLFFLINFCKNSYRNTFRVSNSVNPDQDCSGSKLFAKVISRRHKSLLAKKQLKYILPYTCTELEYEENALFLNSR